MKIPCHLGRRHVLVADGADVGVPLELLCGGLRQSVDLAHRRAPLDEDVPAGLGLAPRERDLSFVVDILKLSFLSTGWPIS